MVALSTLARLALIVPCCVTEAAINTEPKRAVTVADMIEMTEIGEQWERFLGKDPAKFSPSGRRFVVVTRRGSIHENANQYTLILFESANVLRSPKSRVLASVTSSSNSPGIGEVRWLNDSVLLFLAAKADHPATAMSVNAETGVVMPLTAHPTDVMGFDVTADASVIGYTARAPLTSFFTERTDREGFIVADQFLGDLLIGHPWNGDDSGIINPIGLYFKEQKQPARQIDVGDYLPHPGPIAISPDGRRAVIRAWVNRAKLPRNWLHFESAVAPGKYVATLLLADRVAGSVKPLFDAPFAWNRDQNVLWTSNSSVVVVNTWLPAAETVTGRAPESRYTIDVNVANGSIARIVDGSHRLVAWDPRKRVLELVPQPLSPATPAPQGEPRASGRLLKQGTRWTTLNDRSRRDEDALRVFIDQGLNVPPTLVAQHGLRGPRVTLLDPNPQFRGLSFGTVLEINWKDPDGTEIKGGLYLPPRHIEGSRLPLVIQTHGWLRDQFSIDGLAPAGYAAQALAGRGFAVVQLPDNDVWEATPEEGPRYMAMHESVVDYLDAQGVIDRSSVGLLGWSRTGYHVRYSLTFSRHRFAAASIADGMDASYFQYASYLNLGTNYVQIYEAINGSIPFGRGLHGWTDRATGFNLDRVDAPVRLLTFIPSVLLNNWEWFAGLKRLGKPVEHVWLRHAAHTPVRPTERLTAQEGNVDWFDFWLKGREDPDPRKADQYRRWRMLREQRTVRPEREPSRREVQSPPH